MKKTAGTTEAWEDGTLGEDMDKAKASTASRSKAVDEALELQMISIRLPKSVIEDFKLIAEVEGLGYQPLMRTALIRFAECELKRVGREYATQLVREKNLKAA